MSLELATTSELIEELFSRTTFAGVLLYSTETHKRQGQRHTDFHLRSSTENASSLYLLEKGVESLKKELMEDNT